MYLKVIQIIFVSTFLFLFGCYEKTTSDGDSIVCTTLAAPAIAVEIFDRETGLANGCNAVVILEDGNYFEEIGNHSGENCEQDFTFYGAYEREGTYTITVSKEGYLDWQQFDVLVTKNVCHVNTVSLQAYLEKQ